MWQVVLNIDIMAEVVEYDCSVRQSCSDQTIMIIIFIFYYYLSKEHMAISYTKILRAWN